MENTDDYSIKVADYLEDAMSDAEQEAFMEQLSNNEELRRQFEDELLVRSLLREQAEINSSTNDLLLQPADEHIAMLEKALENKAKQSKPAPVVPLFRQSQAVAAIFIGIVAIALVVLFVVKKKNSSETIAEAPRTIDTIIKITETNTSKDSTATIDSLHRIVPLPQITQNNSSKNPASNFDSSKKDKIPVLGQISVGKNTIANNHNRHDTLRNTSVQQSDGDIASVVFQKFNKPYTSEDDPVEVSNYYENYKAGNYAAVFSANEKSIGQKGFSNHQDLLNQYLEFYKGICYLADNKTDGALLYLNNVLLHARRSSSVYHKAQWYRTLVILKRKDRKRAIAEAESIVHSGSPYQSRAKEMLLDLQQK